MCSTQLVIAGLICIFMGQHDFPTPLAQWIFPQLPSYLNDLSVSIHVRDYRYAFCGLLHARGYERGLWSPVHWPPIRCWQPAIPTTCRVKVSEPVLARSALSCWTCVTRVRATRTSSTRTIGRLNISVLPAISFGTHHSVFDPSETPVENLCGTLSLYVARDFFMIQSSWYHSRSISICVHTHTYSEIM